VRELVLIESAEETPLTRLLNALGAAFSVVPLEEAELSSNAVDTERVLVITEEQLSRALEVAHSRNMKLPEFFSRFACALVFPAQGAPAGVRALREWTGGGVEMKALDAADNDYSVARSDLCGPFAGLKFGPARTQEDFGLVFENPSLPVDYLIRVGQLGFFTRIKLPATELFVVSSRAVFDVEAELFKNISAAESFAGLGPLILFLNHSGIVYWRSPRCGAAIVIDDPNLRPKYGFVDFQELARCVDELRCAVSIGFIPWNFKRTRREVVELFRSHWPRLSLSIHGCDHTRSEFSLQTASRAEQKINLSLDRMRHFSAHSGLSYDKVMVFPQGEFSSAAMQALRKSDFLGVVNTELMDRQNGRGVRGLEMLKPAITCYSGAPIFLRRKAEEPIANFALDLLLGKPCLTVTHHEYFQGGLQPLAAHVRALNALGTALEWANLETVVAKSISVRARADKTSEVRLFSAHSEVPGQVLGGETRFTKAEPLAEQSLRVMVGGEAQACTTQNGHLLFNRRISTPEPVAIDVRVSALNPAPATAQSFKYRARVAARRHLSEFRDNHVAKSSWAMMATSLTRNLMRRL
jgi:hypothetical protein